MTGIAPIAELATAIAVHENSTSQFREWLRRADDLVRNRSTNRTLHADLLDGLEQLRETAKREGQSLREESLDWQLHTLERRIQFLSWTTEPATPRLSPHSAEHVPGDEVVYGRVGDTIYGLTSQQQNTIVQLGSTKDLVHAATKLRFAASLIARSFPEPDARAIAAVRHAAQQLDEQFIAPLIPDATGSTLVIRPIGELMMVPWRLAPSLKGRAVRLAAGSSNHQPDLSPSPTVALCVGPGLETAEVEALANLYPDSHVLEGENATVASVCSALENTDLVHLAAHGSTNPRDPLLSALRFTDGFLTLYELETLARVPSTVILASCRIGAAASTNTVSYGLGAVLTTRGCKQVVASTTAISDRQTTTVMKALHHQLQTGLDAAQALASLHFDNELTQITNESLITIT